MKVDNANSLIFHGIIKDLSNMVELLRVENENMNDIIMDKQKLEHKIQELSTQLQKYESDNYYKNLSLYFLISSLTLFLFNPL